MNLKMLKAALAGLVLSVSVFANAGLIQADYLISGDNGAVLDTSTGLTWLDLSLTDALSKSQALSTYSDFHLATKAEYDVMFTNWFSTFTGFNISSSVISSTSLSDINLVEDWQNLFGLTLIRGPNNYSYGWLERQNTTSLQLGGVYALNRLSTIYPNFTRIYSDAGYNPHSSVGWFMVKNTQNTQSVPEPSTLAIFALGIIGLASRRFKKQ